MSTTESSGKQNVQYRLLVPQLSLMMFLRFFTWGSWSITLELMMSQHNMSLSVGGAFSAGLTASILSPFVLGMLVDRFFASQRVMAVTRLAGTAVLWFVPQALIAQNGALLIGLLFGYTSCYMPTLALTNNIAFHSLSGKDKILLAARVFGTIGWIVAGIFIGVTGISDTIGIFMLAVVIPAILTLYSLTLPNTLAPAKGLPIKARDLSCADVFVLLKVHYFFVFLLCATLIPVPLGTCCAYTASFLADTDVGDVSTAMLLGQMSEISFMLVIPFLFRCLGIKYMLLTGMCAWFVYCAFFAVDINEEGRFLLYPSILLHDVCYGFFFVAGFIYTDRIAGKKIKGQAQSMIVMSVYGTDMLLGSQISGALHNRLVAGQTVLQTWTTFWWIPTVAAVVIATIFPFSSKYNDKEQT